MTQKKGAVKFIGQDGNEFYHVLRSNVQHYFQQEGIDTFANTAMRLKTATLLTAYIGGFICVLTVPMPWFLMLPVWIFMGVACAGIGMSVMHDANHGSYSPNPQVNKALGLTLNLLGGAVFNWKLQHNVLHHTYTNIHGLDDDIDTKAGMRFSPHQTLEDKHKGQFIYAFGLYSLITIYWIFAKDFIQYRQYRKNGVNADKPSVYKRRLLQLILLKTSYLFVFLVVPVVFFQIAPWLVLTGFLLMQMTGGLILSVVFQLAHSIEETTHPLPDELNTIHNSWAVHQMETTVNFSQNSRFITWYVGGLNYQIEHHLFPKICHIHYPKISAIVRDTAAQFNIPYLENKKLSEALRSHIRLLRSLGQRPTWESLLD